VNRELRTRPDSKLAKHAREVGFDGLGADERGSRDLAVAHPLRDEIGHSAFADGQLALGCPYTAARHLGSRGVRPGGRTCLFEDCQSLAQRLSRRFTLLGPAPQAPEGQEHSGALERLSGRLARPQDLLDRLYGCGDPVPLDSNERVYLFQKGLRPGRGFMPVGVPATLNTVTLVCTDKLTS
jgi:hypothetical protein